MSAQLWQFSRQTGAPETFSNPGSELAHRMVFRGDGLTEDVPHFVFQAPAIPARTALESRLYVVIDVSHYELSHPNGHDDIAISPVYLMGLNPLTVITTSSSSPCFDMSIEMRIGRPVESSYVTSTTS